MGTAKFRWSKVYESSEEELVELLRSRKLEGQRIAAEEHEELLQQTNDAAMTIWCAEGSLKIRQGGKIIPLQPGDAIQIESGIPYDLIAGFTGFVCYSSDRTI